jgi:hypothetical protein
MENVSLVERECWRFATLGKSFSTRKYKKTHLHHYRSPRKKLKTQEEKRE